MGICFAETISTYPYRRSDAATGDLTGVETMALCIYAGKVKRWAQHGSTTGILLLYRGVCDAFAYTGCRTTAMTALL